MNDTRLDQLIMDKISWAIAVKPQKAHMDNAFKISFIIPNKAKRDGLDILCRVVNCCQQRYGANYITSQSAPKEDAEEVFVLFSKKLLEI